MDTTEWPDYAKTVLATIKPRNPPHRIQALDSVSNISLNLNVHHPNKRGNPYMYKKGRHLIGKVQVYHIWWLPLCYRENTKDHDWRYSVYRSRMQDNPIHFHIPITVMIQRSGSILSLGHCASLGGHPPCKFYHERNHQDLFTNNIYIAPSASFQIERAWLDYSLALSLSPISGTRATSCKSRTLSSTELNALPRALAAY